MNKNDSEEGSTATVNRAHVEEGSYTEDDIPALPVSHFNRRILINRGVQPGWNVPASGAELGRIAFNRKPRWVKRIGMLSV